MSRIRKVEYAKAYTELEAITKAQSVKGSNAIEGFVTSDERIRAIVNRNSTPLNHSEAEIDGYRDALNAIRVGYPNPEFRERHSLAKQDIDVRCRI